VGRAASSGLRLLCDQSSSRDFPLNVKVKRLASATPNAIRTAACFVRRKSFRLAGGDGVVSLSLFLFLAHIPHPSSYVQVPVRKPQLVVFHWKPAGDGAKTNFTTCPGDVSLLFSFFGPV